MQKKRFTASQSTIKSGGLQNGKYPEFYPVSLFLHAMHRMLEIIFAEKFSGRQKIAENFFPG